MNRYEPPQRTEGSEGRPKDVLGLPGRPALTRTPTRDRQEDPRPSTAGIRKRDIECVDMFSLGQAELRALGSIGKFGTVRFGAVLSRPEIKEQHSSWEEVIERLRELELIALHKLQAPLLGERERSGKPEEVQRIAVLTSRGVQVLRAMGYDEEREGKLHAGLLKGREASHDCRMFEIALQELHNLKTAGCTDYRVFTDSQLKSLVLTREQELHSRGEADAKAQAAQSYGVPMLDQSYVFPDLRIEYTDKAGRRRGINIELYTHHYSKQQRQIKQDAGLKGWDLDDEGHLMEQVFAS